MSNRSLYEIYNSLFAGVIADTDELKQECFRLRHQVYCYEIKTEPVNPAGIEKDEHDDFSAHALLRHRPSQANIGTVRLVLPHTKGSPFPVHLLMQQHGLALPLHYTPETTAEISRFSISKVFRRRSADTMYPAIYSKEDLMDDQRHIIPCMALGLMMMSNQMARLHNIDKYCAVMEPSLMRLLARLGMHFHPIGSLVEYHGMRQVCCATLDEMRESIPRERPDVLEVLTDRGRFT